MRIGCTRSSGAGLAYAHRTAGARPRINEGALRPRPRAPSSRGTRARRRRSAPTGRSASTVRSAAGRPLVARREVGRRDLEVVGARGVRVRASRRSITVERHVEAHHGQRHPEHLAQAIELARRHGGARRARRTGRRPRGTSRASPRDWPASSRGSSCSSNSPGAEYQPSQSRSMAADGTPAASRRSAISTAAVDLPEP